MVRKAKDQGKYIRKNYSFRGKMTNKIEKILDENIPELPKKMELKLPGMIKLKCLKKIKNLK